MPPVLRARLSYHGGVGSLALLILACVLPVMSYVPIADERDRRCPLCYRDELIGRRAHLAVFVYDLHIYPHWPEK